MSVSLRCYSTSLGCPKNRVDTERLLGSLGVALVPVESPDEAELVFINTCAFIQPATEESVRTIAQAIADIEELPKRPLLAVAGCLVGRYHAEDLAPELPEVDLWLDNSDLEEWPAMLARKLGLPEPTVPGRILSTGPSYAWLKISDGCRHACSFCAIPNIRGGHRSHCKDMIVREARALLGDEAIVGLSAETESLVRLINELPDGCIDYIGAGPLHVSSTKPEASVGGNDGSGKTLDAAQINTICSASEFPVVVGGGVTAADMAMLAGTKAAGWFAVSAIAGAEDPEAATREMVSGWKAVRADERHGYAPRIVTHTPATDTQAAQEGSAAAGAEATEKKFTNAKDAKDAQKLAKQQRVDIAARGSKQRDKAHIRQDQVCAVLLRVRLLRP